MQDEAKLSNAVDNTNNEPKDTNAKNLPPTPGADDAANVLKEELLSLAKKQVDEYHGISPKDDEDELPEEDVTTDEEEPKDNLDLIPNIDTKEFPEAVLNIDGNPVTVAEIKQLIDLSHELEQAAYTIQPAREVFNQYISNPLQFAFQTIDNLAQIGVISPQFYKALHDAINSAVQSGYFDQNKYNQYTQYLKQQVEQQFNQANEQYAQMKEQAARDLQTLQKAIGRNFTADEMKKLADTIETETKRRGRLVTVIEAYRILNKRGGLGNSANGSMVQTKRKSVAPKAKGSSLQELSLEDLARAAIQDLT
jgi:F0F1-type ATP synthase membrane subunit b/b'